MAKLISPSKTKGLKRSALERSPLSWLKTIMTKAADSAEKPAWLAQSEKYGQLEKFSTLVER